MRPTHTVAAGFMSEDSAKDNLACLSRMLFLGKADS